MDALLTKLRAIPTNVEKQSVLTPAGQSVFVWDVPKGATMAKAMIQRKGADCRFDFTAEVFDGKDWVSIGGGAHDSGDDPDDVPETGIGWPDLTATTQIRLTINSSKDASFGVSVGFG